MGYLNRKQTPHRGHILLQWNFTRPPDSRFNSLPLTHFILIQILNLKKTGFSGDFQVRHPRCVERITSIDKCSQTQLLIFVLLRGVSTQLVLTTDRMLWVCWLITVCRLRQSANNSQHWHTDKIDNCRVGDSIMADQYIRGHFTYVRPVSDVYFTGANCKAWHIQTMKRQFKYKPT